MTLRSARHLVVAGALAVLAIPLAGGADEPRNPPPPRCEMLSCYDPLFTVQYPHTHSFVTSKNIRVPLPVHYYDGAAALIVGGGDLEALRVMTAGTAYRPVATDRGRGVATLLVAAYSDSDVGPYNEALTAFVVNTEDVVIADSPGAMIAALLDPANEVWITRLILDDQLPIDAGREYLFTPKEQDTKAMSIDIGSAYGHASFDFAEQDGTPIASAHLRLEPATATGPALGLARDEGTHRLAGDVARSGNFRLRGVFRNIEHPDQVAHLTGISHSADLKSTIVAACCPGAQIWFNPETQFGSDIAALGLRPSSITVLKGLRVALDIEL